MITDNYDIMRIMKRFTLYLNAVILAGFLFCALFPVSAADNKTSIGSTAAGSSVWEISKNGNTLFLGGSVHILRDEDFPLPEEYDWAFMQSSILILEADIDKMAEPEIVQYLMARMILPNDKPLQTILNSETYSLLKTKCEEFNFPIESVSMLKPSMITILLTIMEIQKQGFVQQGVDIYYLEKAKETKKTLDFLETVETQIDIITTIGEGYENDYVKYSLQELENSTEEIISIVSDWRNGNAAYTEASIAELKKSWSALYKTLLVDRNNAWMQRFDEFLTDEPVEFVIVGLAHLYGDDGLLRQLEQSGCTVKQLTGSR